MTDLIDAVLSRHGDQTTCAVFNADPLFNADPVAHSDWLGMRSPAAYLLQCSAVRGAWRHAWY